MKPEHQKLQHETREEVSQSQGQRHESQQEEKSFDSVEEALRFDASHVDPPERIEIRLKESLAREPKPEGTSWWRRLFGK